jgi:hypothetical protein
MTAAVASRELDFVKREILLGDGRSVGDALAGDEWIEEDLLAPVFERDARDCRVTGSSTPGFRAVTGSPVAAPRSRSQRGAERLDRRRHLRGRP